ncbi:hypothetical protein QJS10_CPB18g01685 [Acorus calamus]|uniref:Uncharacterized protein n=1 Tax=Acorus calamus TaxID=4465 RepID=A0AAV9CNZ0_ACOCL|nr:hypothetical protein QJS10_CPB18g01685 [Acorus calamus]
MSLKLQKLHRISRNQKTYQRNRDEGLSTTEETSNQQEEAGDDDELGVGVKSGGGDKGRTVEMMTKGGSA